MIKKVFLFSTFSFIAACQSYSETSQCDPERNYIISDPVAMEEYKKLFNEGKIKSYLVEQSPLMECYTTSCVGYNYKKINFIEKYFNDKERQGLYTIKYDLIPDDNCIMQNPMVSNSQKPCYHTIKNKANYPNSKYKIKSNKDDNGVTIITFENIENQTKLYEYSYQIYSTAAMGGPGFGKCRIQKIENKNYKFNPYTFYENP